MLEESGIIERSTPSSTAPARETHRPTSRTASLGDRLIAALLDSMVALSAFAIIGAWSFKKWGYTNGAELYFTGASLLVTGILSGIILFLYLWLLEGCCGATLGKIIVGIRVARSTTHGSFAASAIRNAFRVVDGLGFYAIGAMFAGFSRLRQRLGDMLAGTIVVEEKFSVGAKLFAAVLWIAALTGAGFGLPRVWATRFSSLPPRHFAGTILQLGHTTDAAYLCISGIRIDLRREPSSPADGVTTVDSSLR